MKIRGKKILVVAPTTKRRALAPVPVFSLFIHLQDFRSSYTEKLMM